MPDPEQQKPSINPPSQPQATRPSESVPPLRLVLNDQQQECRGGFSLTGKPGETLAANPPVEADVVRQVPTVPTVPTVRKVPTVPIVRRPKSGGS